MSNTYANLSGAPARIAAGVTGAEPPRRASKPIPEVITLGPPIGGREES